MRSRKLIYGVGVNDWKEKISIEGKAIPEYALWRSVVKRCFNEDFKKQNPTYSDTTCCKEWLSMTKFVEDVSQLKGYGVDKWQLDKDILIKGNKLYSKDTCCFVPKEVNVLLTKRDNGRGEWPVGVSFYKRDSKFQVILSVNGKPKYIGSFITPEEAFQAYKVAKEAQIKEVANKWKDQLDERVYEALMNYTVEITD